MNRRFLTLLTALVVALTVATIVAGFTWDDRSMEASSSVSTLTSGT